MHRQQIDKITHSAIIIVVFIAVKYCYLWGRKVIDFFRFRIGLKKCFHFLQVLLVAFVPTIWSSMSIIVNIMVPTNAVVFFVLVYVCLNLFRCRSVMFSWRFLFGCWWWVCNICGNGSGGRVKRRNRSILSLFVCGGTSVVSTFSFFQKLQQSSRLLRREENQSISWYTFRRYRLCQIGFRPGFLSLGSSRILFRLHSPNKP